MPSKHTEDGHRMICKTGWKKKIEIPGLIDSFGVWGKWFLGRWQMLGQHFPVSRNSGIIVCLRLINRGWLGASWEILHLSISCEVCIKSEYCHLVHLLTPWYRYKLLNTGALDINLWQVISLQDWEHRAYKHISGIPSQTNYKLLICLGKTSLKKRLIFI